MTQLKLGFIPLTDCAPLAVAAARGYFADEGLDVSLVREASWATLRDKVAVGALDGAHLLAPIALASAIGATPMIAPLSLGANSAAITLSQFVMTSLAPHHSTPQSIGSALANLIGERRRQGKAPLRFGIVFPLSIHNFTLRYWLAGAGIDPDRDVHLVVVPPPRMVEHLRDGKVDGVCVGAPWNAVAVDEALGTIIVRGAAFWPAGPDKIFGVAESFAAEKPDTLRALLRALLRAQVWADTVDNHSALSSLLSQPEWIGAPAAAIGADLTRDIWFYRGGLSLPRLEHARWMLAQMRRWNQLPPDADLTAIARRVYRPDLTLHAARSLELDLDQPPETPPLYDGLSFETAIPA